MYKAKTAPVHDMFAELGLVSKLDASGDKDSVWVQAQPFLVTKEDTADLEVTGTAVVLAAAAPEAAAGEPSAGEDTDFGAAKLVFVLGGPGSGKGTLCDRCVQAARTLFVYDGRRY